jgi:hypothetical protein
VSRECLPDEYHLSLPLIHYEDKTLLGSAILNLHSPTSKKKTRPILVLIFFRLEQEIKNFDKFMCEGDRTCDELLQEVRHA